MKTVTFNPESWADAADFADYELLCEKDPGTQIDMIVPPESNPCLLAWLFGRIDEHNRFRGTNLDGTPEPKLVLEGVSHNYCGNGTALVSFAVK